MNMTVFNAVRFQPTSEGFVAFFPKKEDDIVIPEEGVVIYETETKIVDEFTRTHTDIPVGIVTQVYSDFPELKAVINVWRRKPTAFAYDRNRKRFYVQ